MRFMKSRQAWGGRKQDKTICNMLVYKEKTFKTKSQLSALRKKGTRTAAAAARVARGAAAALGLRLAIPPVLANAHHFKNIPDKLFY